MRQAQFVHRAGRGDALEGDVVDGHDRGDLARPERREPCLPVVAMQHIRHPSIRQPVARDCRRRPAERRETARIVRPVGTGFVDIKRAGAVEQMRRIQQQHLQPRDLTGHDPGRAAVKIGVRPKLGGVLQPRHEPAIGRDQGAQLPAKRGQCGGQGAHHIGKTAGLHQRRAFRGDREDAARPGLRRRLGTGFGLARRLCLGLRPRFGGGFRRSLFRGLCRPGRRRLHFEANMRLTISCVISVTPPSLTRNHFASSAGSSPTTSPSGISTPRSMTTLVSSAWRPILT